MIIKPSPYMQFLFESVEGMRYKQPTERVNGKSYFEHDEGTYIRDNWGKIKWDNYTFDNIFKYSNYYSELWVSQETKDKAFNKIYDFVKSGKNKEGGMITSLFPFEIYLMNDGFEMDSFCCLNAMDCGVSLYFNPPMKRGINECVETHPRRYVKGDHCIYLAFGMANVNFYFKSNKYKGYFQVDNNIENYEKAINGELKEIEWRKLA